MKIINTERKNKGKVKIFLDGAESFEIPEIVFKQFNFKDDISHSQYEFIIENILYNEARDKALKYLGASSKSISQITDKLIDYPQSVIKKVIEFLVEYNYADDELFAKNYIYDCLTLKHYGKTKIKFDLRQKNIDDEIISRAIENYIDDEKEIESAMEFAQLKFNCLDEKSCIKLKNMLYRRGFSFNIIDRVIKKLLTQ